MIGLDVWLAPPEPKEDPMTTEIKNEIIAFRHSYDEVVAVTRDEIRRLRP